MKKISGYLLIAAAAFALALGAVYGISGSPGNEEIAAACGGAPARAGRLAGLNEGAVAAFQLADSPHYLGDLRFADADGRQTGLEAHRGQLVLLNLWATWCAPCREEMPALKALQAELGGAGFQVLPVSVDLGDPAKPLAFYAEHDLDPLPFRFDGAMAVFERLKRESVAFGLPATVLIDEKGCMLGKMNGPADWAGADARALIEAAIAGPDS
jgi:thiol-disulfide isomerase/thioredoxin